MTAGIDIDEDSMDRSLVTALRVRGADVLTAFEADMIERDDIDHFLYSTRQQRVRVAAQPSPFSKLGWSSL